MQPKSTKVCQKIQNRSTTAFMWVMMVAYKKAAEDWE